MAGPSWPGSMPSTDRSPPVTGETQAIMRIVVVLPAPLGPRNPNTSPRCTSKSTPSTATYPPKRLVRPRAEISGRVAVGRRGAASPAAVGGLDRDVGRVGTGGHHHRNLPAGL